MALEIQDNPKFYHREWIVQRVGWVCILLIIIAGILGFTGRGPFGEASLGDGPLRIRYDRIMRHSAPGTIEITANPSVSTDTIVRLWADSTLVAACHPQQIVPTPARMISHTDTLYLEFSRVTSASAAHVTIACEPDKMGRHAGTLGIVNGPKYTLHTMVLP